MWTSAKALMNTIVSLRLNHSNQSLNMRSLHLNQLWRMPWLLWQLSDYRVSRQKIYPNYCHQIGWSRHWWSWLMWGRISKVRLLTLLRSFYLTRSFWNKIVAYKRFADNIPLAIDLELVQGAEQNILSTLYSNLGINGQDGVRVCKELAQESPQVADRRADLLKKLERLEIASDELLHVGG